MVPLARPPRESGRRVFLPRPSRSTGRLVDWSDQLRGTLRRTCKGFRGFVLRHLFFGSGVLDQDLVRLRDKVVKRKGHTCRRFWERSPCPPRSTLFLGLAWPKRPRTWSWDVERSTIAGGVLSDRRMTWRQMTWPNVTYPGPQTPRCFGSNPQTGFRSCCAATKPGARFIR